MKQLRINQDIIAPEVSLIDEEGKALGLVSRDQALFLAHEAGLDLVMLSDTQTPPLTRLMDYGKYLYAQQKQESKQKAHAHKTELKEVRLGIKIGEHDLAVKESAIKRFLERGDRVKISLQLRGREMMLRDKVPALFERIKTDTGASFEKEAERLGNRFSTILIKNKE